MPSHLLKPNGTASNSGWTITGASAHAAVLAADHPATPAHTTNISTVNSAGDTIVFDFGTATMTGTATLVMVRVWVTSTAGWWMDCSLSGDGGSSWETVQTITGGSGAWVGFVFRVAYSSLSNLQVSLTGYGDDSTQDTTIEAVEVAVVESGTAINTGVAPFLSGLKLLIEADGQGVGNGIALSVVTDTSGNDNHGLATETGRPTYVSNVHNGRGVLRFDSGELTSTPGDYFDLPNLMAGASAGEMVVVMKTSTPAVAFPSCGAWHFGTDAADNSHFRYGAADIYENFGNTARKHWTPSSPAVAAQSWLIYDVYSAAGDWAAFIDGALSTSDATNTVGWNATPTFGRSRDTNIFYQGDVAAVIIFGRKLNSTERGQVYAYLYNKYFLSASGSFYRRFILPRGIAA